MAPASITSPRPKAWRISIRFLKAALSSPLDSPSSRAAPADLPATSRSHRRVGRYGVTIEQQPGAPLPTHVHPLRRGADGVLRETSMSERRRPAASLPTARASTTRSRPGSATCGAAADAPRLSLSATARMREAAFCRWPSRPSATRTSFSAAASTPARGPFCDGTHSNLPGGYLTDDPDSPENRTVATWPPSAGPIVQLDGQCYVFSTSRATLTPRGSHALLHGGQPRPGRAVSIAVLRARSRPGASPVISADGRHTVLFVIEGERRDRDQRSPLCRGSAHRHLCAAERSLSRAQRVAPLR